MDLKKLLDKKCGNKNESDMVNGNIGPSGTNVAYDKAQGSRGKQLNPNWVPNKPRPGAPDDEDRDGEEYGLSETTNNYGKLL
jgi:hypothetical protein